MGKLFYRYYLEINFKENRNAIWDSEELLDCYNFTDFKKQDLYFEEKPKINEINHVIDKFKYLYKVYCQEWYKKVKNKIVKLEDIKEDIEAQEFFVYKKYYQNEEDYNSYIELENLTERIY